MREGDREDAFRRIEMRQSHAITNLKMRKALYESYNRKAQSNFRASLAKKESSEREQIVESQLRHSFDKKLPAMPRRIGKDEAEDL